MFEGYGEIEEVKNYEKTYEEREIEWQVMHISYVIKSGKAVYNSPSFSFAGNSWHFKLYPKSGIKNGFMCLCLFKENCNDSSVDYTYGVKKLDGNLENLGGGFFKEGDPSFSGPFYFIKLSELEERKSELSPSDVLTLICILKREIRNSQQLRVSDKPKLKKLIKLDTLSENFKDLFANEESSDTTLRVKNREYKVHRAVLIARSSVFAARFLHDTKQKQTNVIPIMDCDPESFGEFLEFLYCGKLEKFSVCSALHLYVTSDKYDVQELKAFCIEYMIENLTAENLCDVVIFADKYHDVMLFSAAQIFFNKNSNKIFQTSEWECLMKNNFGLANKLLIKVPKMIIAK